jgi:SNF2 family DNA or RNA helicase
MLSRKTYGSIKFVDHHWQITEAEPHVRIKLKALFNHIPKTNAPPYKFKNTDQHCSDLLWFMERYPMKISQEDFDRLADGKNSYVSYINDLESLHAPDYVPRLVKLNEGEEARPYQLVGAETWYKTKRLLIGDQVGLGKTLVAILGLLYEGALPAIVAVQTHLPKQWKDEIERFTNLNVHIIKKTKPYDLPAADVYIFKYGCLAGWIDMFGTILNVKSVVFDECQELRRCESQRYEAAKRLSESAQRVCGLSATPIFGYGEEIWNILNCINPYCLGTKEEFQREWCGGYGGVVQDTKALGTFLRENFLFLRRTRQEVGRELPIVNTIVHTVGYDNHEVQKIEHLARQLAMKVTTGTFHERGEASRELDMLVRQNTGVAKAKEVAAYVRILLEEGEPVILAAWHRAVYEIFLEELHDFNPVMYTGSESGNQKEKSKQAFINGETNLFILSLRSGVGMDGLQKRCNTIVIAELDWTPSIHHQLIGRIDRDGQGKQVTAIYLVCDEGSDPDIVDLLALKSSQSHGIIDPLKSVQAQHTDESRIKLLAERYLKKHGHE